jgi:predicted MFS family arabinose efflux permease
MNTTVPHINFVLAWTWILLGFGSGTLMGLKFHNENWLGGYTSHKRRLYRLGHISFFGLAMINLCFYFTARQLALPHLSVFLAGWALVVGAVAMPLCCLVMAHFKQWRHLFAIPVTSLLIGCGLTLWEVIKP